MKSAIKSIVPPSVLRWYRRFRYKKENSKYANISVNETFKTIYTENAWGSPESLSGTGSDLLQTETVISEIQKIINSGNYSSLLDLPCGDFFWMKKVDLSKIKYTGADIVPDIIEKNNAQFAKDNIEFKCINMISDTIPKTDIIFTRDCLVHLSFSDISKSLENIKASGSSYFLTTTFINHRTNYDIVTGDWRAVNLQKPPFNFPKPILIINENCKEGNGAFRDKSLALWEIDKIP